jgi:hypothetical protein
MYNNYSYQNPYQGYMNQYQQVQQPQLKTNKVWVTSLEDAMARSVEPNSEYIYLHQDKPLLIEVRTDGQGRKTTRVMELKDYVEQPKPENTMPNNFPTRQEFEVLQGKIKALEERLPKDIIE